MIPRSRSIPSSLRSLIYHPLSSLSISRFYGFEIFIVVNRTLHPFFTTLRHSNTLPRYSFSRSIVHPSKSVFRTHLACDQLLHRSLERSPPSTKLSAIDTRHLLAEGLNQTFFKCKFSRLRLRHTFFQTRRKLRLIRWRVHRSIHQRPTHSLIRHARKDIVTDFVNSCVRCGH